MTYDTNPDSQGHYNDFGPALPEIGPALALEPTPAAMRAQLVTELYHAALDAFTQPEPELFTRRAQVAHLMLMEWGLPVLGRELNQSVQRWRDMAREQGKARLRETLLSIEKELGK